MAVSIRIKEGLIERLRENRGIASEEAFARLVGVERSTLRRIAAGSTPSGAFMASFCDAFGLGLGEAFDIVRDEAPISRVKVAA